MYNFNCQKTTIKYIRNLFENLCPTTKHIPFVYEQVGGDICDVWSPSSVFFCSGNDICQPNMEPSGYGNRCAFRLTDEQP